MRDPSPARLAPLDEPDWPASLESVRAGFGTVLNVHRVMAHHPELLAAWAPLRNHVATQGTLSARHRELVILRLAHRTGVAYEWHHHAARAAAAGITAAELEAVRLGAAGWGDEREALLLEASDELFDELTIGDANWAALSSSFEVPQILDLIVTVGLYTTLAMFISSTGVQIEPDA